MRIAELLQLKRKDIEIKERIIVKIPADYTKSKKGRTTFFSKEAQTMLIPKIKKLSDDDFIFGKNCKTPLKSKSVNEMITLSNYLRRLGLDAKYDNGHNKITTHSFRAFFITKISRHDPNFAKKIAGQKGYLLQYDRMSEKDKLEKYLELESELLVFDESKKNAEMEILRKKNSSLNQIYEDEIKRTRQTVDYLVEEIAKLKQQ